MEEFIATFSYYYYCIHEPWTIFLSFHAPSPLSSTKWEICRCRMVSFIVLYRMCLSRAYATLLSLYFFAVWLVPKDEPKRVKLRLTIFCCSFFLNKISICFRLCTAVCLSISLTRMQLSSHYVEHLCKLLCHYS